MAQQPSGEVVVIVLYIHTEDGADKNDRKGYLEELGRCQFDHQSRLLTTFGVDMQKVKYEGLWLWRNGGQKTVDAFLRAAFLQTAVSVAKIAEQGRRDRSGGSERVT